METQLPERQHRRDPHQNQYIPLPHPDSVGEGSFLYIMCLLNDMKTVECFPQNKSFTNSYITFLQNKTFNNSHTHLLVVTHTQLWLQKKIQESITKKKKKQATAHEEKK